MTLISRIYLRGVSITILNVIRASSSARLQDSLITQSDTCPAAPVRRSWRAARREDALPYGSAGTVPKPRRRAIGSAGERLVHTEEVTGSIPVSPTQLSGRLRS